MSFGLLPIQTHIMHYHLIDYIQTTLGYLGITCGRSSRQQSTEMDVMMQQRLINSMFLILLLPEAANSCFIFPQVWSCTPLAWAK
jgi:hypothetical protein